MGRGISYDFRKVKLETDEIVDKIIIRNGTFGIGTWDPECVSCRQRGDSGNPAGWLRM